MILALLAAVANATASVLQRKAAGQVPDVKALRPALIRELFHYPVWFAGVGAVMAGFLLQAVALSMGTLALVQPLLIAELPLTMVGSALVFHSRLGSREWTAIAAMTAGLACALASASPSGGASDLPTGQWIIGIFCTGAGIAALFVVGMRSDGAGRAAYLGIATGAAFGLTAALMKAATTAFGNGAVAGFTSWKLYLMIICGITAMFLLQSALQAGRLAASQPGLTITDPVVATLWGIVLFGETFRTGGFIVAEVAGIAAIAAGVVILARSPQLSDEAGKHEQDEQATTAATSN